MCLRVSAAHLSHISSWPDPCWRHGAERKSWLLANRLDHGTLIYKEKLRWDGIKLSSWASFPPRTARIHMHRYTHSDAHTRNARDLVQDPCHIMPFAASSISLSELTLLPSRPNRPADPLPVLCASPLFTRPCHIAWLQLPSHLHPSSPRAASCPGSFWGSFLPSSC